MNAEDSVLVKMMSFLFPFIGLIIFAVNVGKNYKLASKAAKYAFFGIVVYFLIMMYVFEGSEAFFGILAFIGLYIIIYLIVRRFVK